MDTYMERIKSNAEKLAKEVFPKKALELDDLINSSHMSTNEIGNVFDVNDFPKSEELIFAAATRSSSSSEMNQENSDKDNQEEPPITCASKKRKLNEINGTKVIVFPNGAIPCNKKVSELLGKIKPFVIHFLDSSAVLKLWIQILIPKVEDFKAELSLQIQEDSLAEIRAIESEVATYLDHIYKYHAIRGKLVSKVAKYPHVEDYRQTVCELDEKMFMTARLVSLELRNHYTTVHDILMKNMEKIKKPRTNNTISMY